MIYSYLRKSAEENAEKSFETQRYKILAYCNLHELNIDREFTDISSGSILFRNRDSGHELSKLICKGDTIIASVLDRFSRNHYDLISNVEKYKRMGVKLIFTDIGDVVSSDSLGRIFYQILSIMSEWYSTSLSEKQKYAKQRMIEQQKYTGGFVKKGFDLDTDTGKLVEIEKEQKQIRDIVKFRKSGMKYREIQDEIFRIHKQKYGYSTLHKLVQRGTGLKVCDAVS